MLFFVPPERRRALRMRLQKLLCIPFTFSDRGSHVVVYEPEEVYDKSLADERGLVYGRSNGDGAQALSLARASEATFGINRLKSNEQSRTISS